jgi:excisionase family DNA binding protein
MSALHPRPTGEQFLTVKDLTKLLKVSRRTIYRWVAQKRLPEPIRCSRRYVRWKARRRARSANTWRVCRERET